MPLNKQPNIQNKHQETERLANEKHVENVRVQNQAHEMNAIVADEVVLRNRELYKAKVHGYLEKRLQELLDKIKEDELYDELMKKLFAPAKGGMPRFEERRKTDERLRQAIEDYEAALTQYLKATQEAKEAVTEVAQVASAFYDQQTDMFVSAKDAEVDKQLDIAASNPLVDVLLAEIQRYDDQIAELKDEKTQALNTIGALNLNINRLQSMIDVRRALKERYTKEMKEIYNAAAQCDDEGTLVQLGTQYNILRNKVSMINRQIERLTKSHTAEKESLQEAYDALDKIDAEINVAEKRRGALDAQLENAMPAVVEAADDYVDCMTERYDSDNKLASVQGFVLHNEKVQEKLKAQEDARVIVVNRENLLRTVFGIANIFAPITPSSNYDDLVKIIAAASHDVSVVNKKGQ